MTKVAGREKVESMDGVGMAELVRCLSMSRSSTSLTFIANCITLARFHEFNTIELTLVMRKAHFYSFNFLAQS